MAFHKALCMRWCKDLWLQVETQMLLKWSLICLHSFKSLRRRMEATDLIELRGFTEPDHYVLRNHATQIWDVEKL